MIAKLIVFGVDRPRALARLREALADGAEDTYPLQQLMRRRLGRWVSKRYRARPMIVPVVLAT